MTRDLGTPIQAWGCEWLHKHIIPACRDRGSHLCGQLRLQLRNTSLQRGYTLHLHRWQSAAGWLVETHCESGDIFDSEQIWGCRNYSRLDAHEIQVLGFDLP